MTRKKTSEPSSPESPEQSPLEKVERSAPVSNPMPMTSLQKMRLVSALTGACRNDALLKAFASMEEGSVLLEIFAEAVNRKMEEMFTKADKSDGAGVVPLAEKINELYAKVSAIDLSQIKNNKLKIKINEEDFEISWHPDHFKTVEKSLKD